ncbi:hypothetical protein [Bacillus cereus]|uniref:Cytoplasmic protein n=1 Tax=Bacillus cereus TIAC219 TaxID=718222 RepID=A0ABC9SU06_BACCE|nr:hypothetical protein [Bacillus cereus]EJP84657.1 hypothetical protein IC1_05185 [Bacillus cereus VD022]EOQ59340.1 hypothetical protein IAY_05107 [Bacillus cereus TIAC219]
MSKVSRCCLVCDYRIKMYQSPKDNYQEVTVCPKCKGAFIDVWKLGGKYKQSDDIKGKEEPLLQIILPDINAVPTVLYKGEEIKGRIRVSFDWKTSVFDDRNNTYIHLEFFDDESERCNSKIIQHNHPLKERKFINEERG